MDQLRRDLLRIFGSTATLFSFNQLLFDWERIEHTVYKPSQFDNATFHNLEALNKQFWHLYRISSSKSLVLDGVLGQMKTLLRFWGETRSTSFHHKIGSLTSEIGQLAGEIFFDCQDYQAATSCYTFSATIASEAKDYDLSACALGRKAFISIYSERYTEAVTILQEANHFALQGNSNFATRYWVAAIEAEALAGTGNLSACQKVLDRAQEIANQRVENPTWIRFEQERLPALRGACLIRLHQPDEATPALYEALDQPSFQSPSRRRGLVLLDLASAALQRREIERACTSVQKVLEMFSPNPSHFLREEIRKRRLELEPFAQTTCVQKLDQYIQATNAV